VGGALGGGVVPQNKNLASLAQVGAFDSGL
jgi:hypothetical protein